MKAVQKIDIIIIIIFSWVWKKKKNYKLINTEDIIKKMKTRFIMEIMFGFIFQNLVNFGLLNKKITTRGIFTRKNKNLF